MRKKRLLLGISVVLLIGVVGIGATFYFLWIRPALDRIDFVQQEWLAGDVRARGKMVHDLIDRKLLDGEARSDVVALLGAPDHSSTGSLSYTVDIGHKFGSGPWTYQLLIQLDDSGRVRDHYLHD